MAQLPSDWKVTLASVGGNKLSPTQAEAITQRLRVYGYEPKAHNFGRVLCHLPRPHFHGQRDKDGVLRCMLSSGKYIRVWPDDSAGLRRLVMIAGHDPTADLAGFRTEFAEGGGTKAHDGAASGGVVDTHSEIVKLGSVGWLDRLEEGALLSNPVTAPFGIAKLATDEATTPNEASEQTFQSLYLNWQAFQKAGVPTDPKWAFLKPQFDAWTSYRDQWLNGAGDTTQTEAEVADANTVRKYLAESDPSWNDTTSASAPAPAILDSQPIEQSTAILSTAQKTSDAAATVQKAIGDGTKSFWGSIPTWIKVSGGGLIATILYGAVKR